MTYFKIKTVERRSKIPTCSHSQFLSLSGCWILIIMAIGLILIPFHRNPWYTRPMYKVALVRLYWGLIGGSLRRTPLNPLSTPYQPPINPLSSAEGLQWNNAEMYCQCNKAITTCSVFYVLCWGMKFFVIGITVLLVQHDIIEDNN